MEELMLKIENVSKQYKLGQIGGTTLYREIQRRHARRKWLDDPLRKVDAKDYNNTGDLFMALDGVSFEVKKGERVGIIGHNGAGKSTLLKLISRITAPTGGKICLNGRIASMLEVGTGFHAELTGRENIYMNGAILGMTRKEIDAKIEDIIDFSECREFIDTPVRRYSSGMYVKLAFSVAAHLDSEIMIMDEVLAVGDMAFQKKCLDKMNEVSREDDRTILYVSHNMNTIRELCSRVIVLDHGRIVFDGGVEEGIGMYMGSTENIAAEYEYPARFHKLSAATGGIYIQKLTIASAKNAYHTGDILQTKLQISAERQFKDVRFRCEFSLSGTPIGTMLSEPTIDIDPGADQEIELAFKVDGLMDGCYQADLLAFVSGDSGSERVIDAVYPAFFVNIENPIDERQPVIWKHQWWGHVRLSDIRVKKEP